MKKIYVRAGAERALLGILFAAALVFGFASAASARGVMTDVVQPGTYDLVTTSTPAPIAILKRVDAPYDIKLATAGSGYKVIGGLSQDRAIDTANNFLKGDSEVLKTDIKEIKGPDGSVVGYEVTPVYRPLRWGSAPDATITSYKVSGDKIYAYVTADRLAQDELMGGG